MAPFLHLFILGFLPSALRFAEIVLLQCSLWLLSVEISERWGSGGREKESVLFQECHDVTRQSVEGRSVGATWKPSVCRLGISSGRTHPQPPASSLLPTSPTPAFEGDNSSSLGSHPTSQCRLVHATPIERLCEPCVYLLNRFVLFPKELMGLHLLLIRWLVLLSRRVVILAMYVPYFTLILSMRGTSWCCPIAARGRTLPGQPRAHDRSGV